MFELSTPELRRVPSRSLCSLLVIIRGGRQKEEEREGTISRRSSKGNTTTASSLRSINGKIAPSTRLISRSLVLYKVRRIHSDNAKEFFTAEVTAICTAAGIHQTSTGKYTPEQNGQAERANRTVGEGVATLLEDSGMGSDMTTYAVRHFLYVHNRLSSHVLGGVSPYYALHGKHPNLSNLRVFGCTAIVLKPKHQQEKWGRKAWIGVMVGCDDHNPRAYHIYDAVNDKMEREVHVKFNESQMYMDRVRRPRELGLELDTADVDYDQVSGRITPSAGGDVLDMWHSVGGDASVGAPASASGGGGIDADATTMARIEKEAKAEARKRTERVSAEKKAAAMEEELHRDASEEELEEHSIATGRRKRASKLCQETNCRIRGPHATHSLLVKLEEVDDELAATDRKLGAMERMGLAAAKRLCLTPEVDPSSRDEMLASPNVEKWLESETEEYSRLEGMGAWEKVPKVEVPPGARILDGEMIYKTKLNSEGAADRLKSRGVVKGWRQKAGIDFDESYAPVAMQKTFRMVTAYAAVKDKEMDQVDFDLAFLNAELDEDVYMKDFPGFETIGPDGQAMVLKLKKSLYGLKQSPKNWNHMVHKWLEGYGLKRGKSDHCLYVKKDVAGEIVLIVVIYVDDMLIIGNRGDIDAVKKAVSQEFAVKDLGELKWMLGMKFERDRKNRTIEITQKTYIQQVMEKTGMTESRGAYTPMSPGVQLVASTEQKPAEFDYEYSQAVGSGMYAVSLTRPDAAYWSSRVSRFMGNPSDDHRKAVKNGLRYLNETQDLSLKFGGLDVTELKLEAYADADYASQRENRRSISGYVMMLGGAAVSWKSKQQSCVATSTADAEYVALCEAAKEVVFLRRMCEDLGIEQEGSTPMFEDNQACISMVNSPVYSDRNKHIDVRYHYTRWLVEEGVVEVKYISTHKQLADIFTKALPRDQFQKLRNIIMGHARY